MIRIHTANGEIFGVGADLDWVTKYIAVGGLVYDATEMADLRRQNVTHLLNMSGASNTDLAARYGVRALWNPIDDDLEPKPVEVFERGVNFARHALARKDGRLFVHCSAGMHRGPLMALAILGSMGWELEAAMTHMKRCRPCVGFPEVYLASVRRYLRQSSSGLTQRKGEQYLEGL